MSTEPRRTRRESLVDSVMGRVLISCQAGPESPLNSPHILAALAASAELGGAGGFRVDGPANVAAVRSVSDLPILGINKVMRDGFDVFITATIADAWEVVEAGADIVALDGTMRPRPGGENLSEIIAELHGRDVPVMADIATAEEAAAAVAAGADIIATTLAGYTAETEALDHDGPAFELLRDIRDLPVPVFVEGRIWTREHLVQALSDGASAVIVGSAVTVPELITARLVAASTQFWDGRA